MHKAKADSSDFFLNETFVLLSDVSLLLVWVVVIQAPAASLGSQILVV